MLAPAASVFRHLTGYEIGVLRKASVAAAGRFLVESVAGRLPRLAVNPDAGVVLARPDRRGCR